MAELRTPLHNVIETSFDNRLKSLNTCIPGHILAFVPETQRAQVQVGTVRINIEESGEETRWNLPPVVDVPVCFTGGSNFTLEFQLDVGTEGLILFSQRCTDGWKTTGGIADNPIARFHDMQDAIFIPGIRSLNGLISGHANNGIRLRSNSGSQFVWIKNDGTIVVSNSKSSVTLGTDGAVTTVNDSGSLVLQGDGIINLNGVTITPQGQITVPGSGGLILANGVAAETHRHSGVESGSDTSGGPV